jgi:hypothetical protein
MGLRRELLDQYSTELEALNAPPVLPVEEQPELAKGCGDMQSWAVMP